MSDNVRALIEEARQRESEWPSRKGTARDVWLIALLADALEASLGVSVSDREALAEILVQRLSFGTGHDAEWNNALADGQAYDAIEAGFSRSPEPQEAPLVQVWSRQSGKSAALIERILDAGNERGVRVQVVEPEPQQEITEERVERVARAIAEAHVPTTGPTPRWESDDPAWKDTYRDFARAALEAAFAEPQQVAVTDEMVERAKDAYLTAPRVRGMDGNRLAIRAALEAALSVAVDATGRVFTVRVPDTEGSAEK